jgi:two-component system OmpR family sensor kinase
VMLSLRARLLAAVLVLTAAGLLLFAVITYAEQRHFLTGKVDDQARAAVVAVRGELAERGIGDDRGFGDPGGGRRGGPPRGGGPGVGLPAGTYGQLRDASGRVLGDTVFSYGQNVSANPDLPKQLKLGEITTVSGKGDDDERYRVLATADRFGTDTTVVAVPLHEVDETLRSLLLVEALVIACVLLILAAVAWVVVRVGLLPLDRIGNTADRIAGGDLSHRVTPTDPRTEVGRLGVALNAMLDRLEEAFAERQASEDRLRQFIGDASHELRTPLASIRGYSELHRMGAAREPAEVEKAMRRIEDEAARMGVLVEDLLTLARLDEVAEAPHVEVDVAGLARDAVDDARATAPDRDVDLQSNGPAIVLGDAHQLRQVLGNLLRNALVHTPAGTPVQVSVANARDEVRIEVRDHGDGLPTADTDALFERFWRAEAGRERGKGGAGLGLAIVVGIVTAHGGRVEARNAPGGGASFVVQLPAH